MVDFQSRDTSRGFGEDDDEEEGDEAEASDEQAAESQEEAVAPETGAADGEPADDAAAEGDEDGAETDAAPEQAEGASPEQAENAPTDPADDPLAPSSESESAADSAEGPGDHPFADDAEDESQRGADTAAEASSGTDGRSAAAEPAEQDPTDHRADPDDHAGEIDDHAHESGEHAHDHESGGHSHDHESSGHSHDHTHGAEVGLLGVAVVTVSSTRTRENDPSGDVIEALVEAADHEVVTREILRDDLDGVQTALLNLTGRDDVDVVVTTGGTGVTPDDVTVEGARPLFDRELPGFGELFRILSYEEIGTRAMVSRATAGMVDGVPVFCLPGSEAAARLGTEELVVEEMAHLVSLARRED